MVKGRALDAVVTGSGFMKLIPTLSASQVARFWSHVEKRADDECWLWRKTLDPQGYGKFFLGPKFYKAHRVAWTMANGPVPNGLTLDHICRQRRCVNSAHLEVVTFNENTMRGESLPARNAKKVYCKRGHLITGVKKGGRWCRRCDYDRPSRRKK